MVFPINISNQLKFTWRKRLDAGATQSKVKMGDVSNGTVSGRDTNIIVNAAIYNGPLPEVAAEVYGDGSTRMIRGNLHNKSGQMVTVLGLDINGTHTAFNLSLNRTMPIPGFHYPVTLFTDAVPGGDICLKVEYRTLDGRRYELEQRGKQKGRMSGGFDLVFNEASIKPL